MDSPSHIMQQAQGSCSVHTHGSQSHKGFVHFSLVQSIPTIFPPKHLALARILFCHYIMRSDNDYIHMNHIYLSYQYQQNRHKSFHNEIHVHNFYSVLFPPTPARLISITYFAITSFTYFKELLRKFLS